MSGRTPEDRDRIWFYVAATAFLLAVAYMVAMIAADVGLSREKDAAFILSLAALSAVLGLLGWNRARRMAAVIAGAERRARLQAEAALQAREAELQERLRREAQTAEEKERLEQTEEEMQRELQQKEQEIDKKESELERKEDQVGSKEEQLERERAARSQAQKTAQTTREWNRELRNKLAELRHERGPLGSTEDVPHLVLRTSLALLKAEKGMLLERGDDDGDGEPFEVEAAHGFDSDPKESGIARRFASEVLEQDKAIRENEPPSGDTPADREIENLCAIPIFVRDQFSGVVVCCNTEGGFDQYDEEVLLALGDHAGAVLQNSRLRGQLRDAYLATVRIVADAVEAKDPFLRGHSEEVSGYVAAVADRLGVEARRREELVFGSLLHDVGKIGISERILLKPAELTPEERNVIQLHSRIGYRLVQQVPALRPIAPGILHHHERFDGDGYPAGLRGEEIPLDARIICIADAFSAMTTDRPYRGRMSLEEACLELEACAGTQFDPEIVRIFVEEVRKGAPRQQESSLAIALADPELEVRRVENEPVLGYGAYAVTDNLTLLYSHRYFHEVAHAEAQRAMIQNSPFGIVIVELEDIERINQEDGYAEGDKALQRVAHVVQQAAVRTGGTACRYNGRRLGLVAPDVDAQTLRRVADDVAGGIDDGPSIRTGIALWTPGESGEDVIARARAGLSDMSRPPALP